MPKGKKTKTFYIDTNIALDFATNRDRESVLVIEKIKERGWQCISSTFLTMEMADYKQESLYAADKLYNSKWEIRKILRESDNKKLKKSQLDESREWYENFERMFQKFSTYDFLQDEESWKLAQQISFESNLSAPDVVHLASAIVAADKGYCNYFITKDGLLGKEGKEIIKSLKFNNRKIKLKFFTLAEVKKQYF